MPGAAGHHRAAERPGTAVGHEAGRCQMIGEGVVDQIASAEAGSVHGPGKSPIVGAIPSGSNTGPGEAKMRESRCASGVAVKPPKRRRRLLQARISSDLRVTGRRASDGRSTDLVGLDAGEPVAIERRVVHGVPDQARHGMKDRDLALAGVTDLLAIVVVRPKCSGIGCVPGVRSGRRPRWTPRSG